MIMIKSLLRFFLAFVLCCMLVYAPEILSSVSPPYRFAAPERILLRIALHCSHGASEQLYPFIHAYQKQYPYVHLRIIQINADLLSNMSLPYPDIVFCSTGLTELLPSTFSAGESFSLASTDLICAQRKDSPSASAAAEFAAYIYEALFPDHTPSEI